MSRCTTCFASNRVGNGLRNFDEPQSVNLQCSRRNQTAVGVDLSATCEPTTILLAGRRTGNLHCRSSHHQPQPSPKKYQIALFIGSDAKSKQLLDWFNHDSLSSTSCERTCDFQVYTASNALYKTRFATIVPVEQFPVVLFQDNTGGHVHAAGRSMLPATPAELFADLRPGLPTLSTDSASPEDRRTENARLFVGRRDLAESCNSTRKTAPTVTARLSRATAGGRPIATVTGIESATCCSTGLAKLAMLLLWASAGELATIATDRACRLLYSDSFSSSEACEQMTLLTGIATVVVLVLIAVALLPSKKRDRDNESIQQRHQSVPNAGAAGQSA